MSPDFLAIGHIARDLSSEGHRIGGAVTFGALTATKMGLSAAIVTSVGPELGIGSTIFGIPVHAVPSSETTTFCNTYLGGRRTQIISSIAQPIGPSDIPPDWRSAQMVLLGPLAGEVSYDLVKHFPGSLVGASIQGWLREWDSQGRVAPRYWEGREVLPYLDAAVVSTEDVKEQRLIDLWADITPVLIVTAGGGGARLHFNGNWHKILPFPAREVDPTGAGDVFAAAYLARYWETGEPLASASFASCAASFCAEAKGVDGIPTRAQVQQRLSRLGR